MKKFLMVFVLFFVASCFARSTPAIYFQNCSGEYIYKVGGIWNKYRLAGNIDAKPGLQFSQNFYITSKSQFFGPVHLEWQNAKGKTLTKDFIFEEKEFEGVKLDKLVWSNVMIQFDQEGVKYYTDAMADYKENRLKCRNRIKK